MTRISVMLAASPPVASPPVASPPVASPPVASPPVASPPVASPRAAALFAGMLLAMPAMGDDLNDYPTVARADYVFACMKAGGETRSRLEQCSCSIDIVASILPYDRYVTAETLLSLAQTPGERGGTFRSTEQAKAALNDLRRAQAEAEVRCF